MGRLQSYRATPGLNRFPDEKQFCVWLGAHKRLKTVDPVYRSRCRRFAGKIILIALMYTITCCMPTLIQHVGIIPHDSGPAANPNIILAEMVVPCIIALIATVIFLPCILIMSFHEQSWRNQQVAKEIEKEPATA